MYRMSTIIIIMKTHTIYISISRALASFIQYCLPSNTLRCFSLNISPLVWMHLWDGWLAGWMEWWWLGTTLLGSRNLHAFIVGCMLCNGCCYISVGRWSQHPRSVSANGSFTQHRSHHLRPSILCPSILVSRCLSGLSEIDTNSGSPSIINDHQHCIK